MESISLIEAQKGEGKAHTFASALGGLALRSLAEFPANDFQYSWEGQMQKLFQTCVLTSCVSVLSLVVFGNMGLALTTRGYCVTILTIPFSDKIFEIPGWLLRPTVWVCVASTLAASALWTVLLVKRVRLRLDSVSKA